MVVFHDLDKLTGSSLHLFPLLTMWNIHWNIRGTTERTEWGFYDVGNSNLSFEFLVKYFQNYFSFYFSWAVVYYFIITYACWNTIINKNYYCLVLDELYRGQYIKPVREKYGKYAGQFAFVLKHFIYTVACALAMLPAFFIRFYSVALLLYFVCLLIKRGGDYYIDHFSKKYEANLVLLDELGKKYDPLGMRPEHKLEIY